MGVFNYSEADRAIHKETKDPDNKPSLTRSHPPAKRATSRAIWRQIVHRAQFEWRLYIGSFLNSVWPHFLLFLLNDLAPPKGLFNTLLLLFCILKFRSITSEHKKIWDKLDVIPIFNNNNKCSGQDKAILRLHLVHRVSLKIYADGVITESTNRGYQGHARACMYKIFIIHHLKVKEKIGLIGSLKLIYHLVFPSGLRFGSS